ncbi:LytR/AlgR family response regulator transcription factor [Ferruginibacter sp.]
MLKILIVDDEAAAGNILKVLIEKHIPLQKEIRCCNSPEEALQLLPQFKPGLVMLDIEMPSMNGFDFLNNAASWDFDVIFTTAFDKYAIKAIRFSALDYLLKPVDIVDLQNAINRHIIKKEFQGKQQQQQLVDNLLNNLQQKNTADFKLAISVKEGVFLFETKDIICLEGMNNYTRFYFTDQKPLLVAKTLKDYEEILTEHRFIRIHKSFLVNIHHVKRMDTDHVLWLSNDVQVPVSRRKRNEVMELFQ